MLLLFPRGFFDQLYRHKDALHEAPHCDFLWVLRDALCACAPTSYFLPLAYRYDRSFDLLFCIHDTPSKQFIRHAFV